MKEESPISTSRTLKDGYESDSTLSYRKHCYTPTNSGPSPQAKALYTQVPKTQKSKAIEGPASRCLKVQKGGDVPLQGLRMQAPEKKGKTREELHDNTISMLRHTDHDLVSFSS